MEAPTRARRRRTRAPAEAPTRAVDYRHLTSSLPLAEGYSEDQIAEIHVTALTVLQELGVRVNHAGAREILARAGAAVSDSQVRFGREIVEAAIASSPPEFTVTSGCGTLHIGGRSTQFLPAGGPPYAMDTARGKRTGTLEDFRNFVRLSQTFDVIHMTAPSVEPQDIPPKLRHLRMMRSLMLDSDKPTFIYSRGAGQVADSFEILRLRYGLDEDAFSARPHTYTVINTNSPLILDVPMCQGLIDFAAAGQMCIITPFTLSGAMAPVTIPGALVQQHAEMLAGLVLTQTVRPGAHGLGQHQAREHLGVLLDQRAGDRHRRHRTGQREGGDDAHLPRGGEIDEALAHGNVQDQRRVGVDDGVGVGPRAERVLVQAVAQAQDLEGVSDLAGASGVDEGRLVGVEHQ